MLIDRRYFIQGAASLLALAGPNSYAQDSTSVPLPNRRAFEAGDFLWPKKPGAYVPYNYNTNRSAPDDERLWHSERDAFIAKLKRSPEYFSQQDIQYLQQLSYREFYARYVGDQRPGVPGLYSSGGAVYVGHVGIIEIDAAGAAWVVEALSGRGVVRARYDDWLASRAGEAVWHGRLRDVPADHRAKVVTEAKKMVGRPYNFWNFNLADDIAFYCSKLAWLAVWNALGFAVDGNSNPKRVFWFSPKQLLYSKTIVRLHDPGPYANG